MTYPKPLRDPRSSWRRLAIRVGMVVAIVFLLHFLIDWATSVTAEAGNMPMMIGLLALLLLVYALLMAIPFAPGIEVGVSLLMLRGAEIAPFVFTATILGLSVAFLAGRFVPYARLHTVCRDLRLESLGRLLERIDPLDRDQRLSLLSERLPSWMQPMLGRARYLILALLLNLPGNAFLGGGGGLAFIAGFSRLYSPPATLAVMALAVLPVPLTVWLYGAEVLESD